MILVDILVAKIGFGLLIAVLSVCPPCYRYVDWINLTTH